MNLESEDVAAAKEQTAIAAAAQTAFGADFVDLALNFWGEQPFFYDESGIWWLWDHKNYRYRIIDDMALFNSIYESLRMQRHDITRPMTKSMIKTGMQIAGRRKMPKELPEHYVQFKDQLVDLNNVNLKLKAGPAYHSVNSIPWHLGDSEYTPTIDRLFMEWVGKDKAKLLWEIAAYSMLRDYPLHRMFVFVGSGSNGKDCYLRFVENLLGSYNCVSKDLEELSERFGTSAIYKKLVVIISETNHSRLRSTSKLKQLTGNSLMSYEFKNKTPFSGRNYGKILIASNSLPDTTDRTEGWYRRQMVVEFPNKFVEKKDILSMIPRVEYENACLKCLNILADLIIRREFTGEGSIEDRRAAYEKFANPFDKFIKDYCILAEDAEVPSFEFRDAWENYRKQNGHRELSRNDINAKLRESYDIKIQPKHPRTEEYPKGDQSKLWSYYLGIRFRHSHEVQAKLETKAQDTTAPPSKEIPAANTAQELIAEPESVWPGHSDEDTLKLAVLSIIEGLGEHDLVGLHALHQKLDRLKAIKELNPSKQQIHAVIFDLKAENKISEPNPGEFGKVPQNEDMGAFLMRHIGKTGKHHATLEEKYNALHESTRQALNKGANLTVDQALDKLKTKGDILENPHGFYRLF